MGITKNSVVFFHYTLTLENGEEIDSSKEGDEFAYLHGHGNIVSGLESEMEGKEAGDHVDAKVAPADGYGEVDPSLDFEVPKTAFPPEAIAELEPGMMFQAQHPTEEDQDIVLRVMAVEEGTVMVSGNHPLAGETLNFSVDVVSIRDASTEELAHGHVHGPGGHH